jgi:hypothetical protein
VGTTLVSHNESLPTAINLFSKLLKTKIFISQKFLDTPLFRLIRFRQKVLTVFCPVGTILPKREGRPLPGWPFCLKSNHRSSICSRRRSGQKPNRAIARSTCETWASNRAISGFYRFDVFVQEFDQPISGWLISCSESRPTAIVACPNRAHAATIGVRSGNTLRSPPRIYCAELALRKRPRTDVWRRQRLTQQLSLRSWRVRIQPTTQPSPLRTPRTWDSERSGRNPPPRVVSGERPGQVCRVPSTRSPRRSV